MLSAVNHRPWDLPKKGWVIFMRWHDLLFAHWPIPSEFLRPLIPEPLHLDTFEGQAWIGIVPFRMTHVHLRKIPPLPGFASSLEINVRTYVVLNGKPGVWFFSLDAGNPVAVWMARHFFHLPYYRAEMSCRESSGSLHYESCRRSIQTGPAHFRAHYRPIGAVAHPKPQSLEHWLTERYCLYAEPKRGKIWRCDIHHNRWPLQTAKSSIEVNTMTDPLSIKLSNASPLLHFARRLDTVIWAPEKVV